MDPINHVGFELYFENKAYKNVYEDTVTSRLNRIINPFSAIKEYAYPSRDPWDAAEYHGFNYLDAYFLAISNALCESNSTFYSSVISAPDMNRINPIACKELDHYIVHADFSKGLSIVPKAENFRDIIELRADPNLRSFREVFSVWVDYFVRGDIDSFKKIKQDVVNANENLCKLKKYERVTNSPLYNILSVLIGGNLPILSNILGGLGVLSSFAAPKIELYNRWINLPAFRGDMARFYRTDINHKK